MYIGFPFERPQVMPSLASTFTPDHERFIKEWLEGRKIVLEVGSGIGVTTEYMARHANLVYACDPWKEEQFKDGKSTAKGDHPFDIFCVNCWHARLKIIPIHGRVETVLPWMAANDIELDVIYLDASHQFAELTAHIELVRQYYPDSVIAGDDYNWSYQADMPVFRAVNKASSNGYHLTCSGPMWKLTPKKV